MCRSVLNNTNIYIMNIPDFHILLNNLGFAGKVTHMPDIHQYRKEVPEFKSQGIVVTVDLYFNNVNNHILVTCTYKTAPNQPKSIFSGRVRSKEEFKQLLEMLYL